MTTWRKLRVMTALERLMVGFLLVALAVTGYTIRPLDAVLLPLCCLAGVEIGGLLVG